MNLETQNEQAQADQNQTNEPQPLQPPSATLKATPMPDQSTFDKQTVVSNNFTSAQLPSRGHKRKKELTLGIIIFAVIALPFFFLPILPGKILRNGAGNSYSIDSGTQAVSCSGDFGQLTTTTEYQTKKGFPITYSYQATSSVSGVCNGVRQAAAGGKSSQFNLLGVVIDFVSVGIISFVLTKIIRNLKK